MDDLKEREREILKCVIHHVKTKGYPPSVREIGKEVGLKSPASVFLYLNSLHEKGYIKKDNRKPRAIEVLCSTDDTEDFSKPQKEMIEIPIVGRITAGEPILAEENIEDYFPLPINFLNINQEEVFMLQVKGESMVDAGIFDGDYAIIKKQQIANDGDIVAALIDDEATIKRFYLEDDCIRLQPENDSYEPIYVEKARILGKAITIIRNLD